VPCIPFNLGNGTTGIICTRGPRKFVPCSVPGCGRPSVRLCDWPVTRAGVKGTCDAKLCARHATHVGPDRDYCPPHAKLAPKQEALKL
jgi:hypothetical protein